MITDIKGKAEGLSPVAAGAMDYLRMTRLGQLLTADWKLNLLLSGKLWRVSVGALTAGAAETLITGGGAGTVPDMEQPEIIVGVDAGYYLIPIEIDACVTSDIDAPDDYLAIMAIMDRTNSAPTSLTGTVVTPENQLDGAGAFPGRAFKEVTADIEDPVYSELLMYRRKQVIENVLNGTSTNVTAPVLNDLVLHYEPSVPTIGKGPCSIVVMWHGSVAATGLATVVFGCVPADWVE